MIFENKQTEISHVNESVEDILSDFMTLLIYQIIPIKEDDYIMKILNREVVMYFGLITNNIILNWQVVCENMMRYVINQDRYIKCYNRMI